MKGKTGRYVMKDRKMVKLRKKQKTYRTKKDGTSRNETQEQRRKEVEDEVVQVREGAQEQNHWEDHLH